MRRGSLIAALALAWASCPAAEPVTFERDARPVFKAYCLPCHGAAETLPGNLDLRLRRWPVAGAASAPPVVPGAPGRSLLLRRMKAGEFPPGEGKVPPEQVAVIEA